MPGRTFRYEAVDNGRTGPKKKLTESIRDRASGGWAEKIDLVGKTAVVWELSAMDSYTVGHELVFGWQIESFEEFGGMS